MRENDFSNLRSPDGRYLWSGLGATMVLRNLFTHSVFLSHHLGAYLQSPFMVQDGTWGSRSLVCGPDGRKGKGQKGHIPAMLPLSGLLEVLHNTCLYFIEQDSATKCLVSLKYNNLLVCIMLWAWACSLLDLGGLPYLAHSRSLVNMGLMRKCSLLGLKKGKEKSIILDNNECLSCNLNLKTRTQS